MSHRLFIPVVFFALCGVSCGGQEDVPALIHKLKDNDKDVRWLAAFALGVIGPAADQALIAAIKENNEQVRMWAAYA